MMRTSRRDPGSQREPPAVGWRQDRTGRMDRGGRAERAFPYYAPPGFSPVTKERRVPARRRAGDLQSPIWVAPQKFQDFCPKSTCQGSFCGMEVFFLTPFPGSGRGFEGSGSYGVQIKARRFFPQQLHFLLFRGKLIKLNRSRRSGTGQRGISWKTRRNGFSAASSPAAN